MALIGYVRCSTDKQTVRQQIDALRAAGCERKNIYKDKATSATAKKRPGLIAVKNALKPGDTFAVVAIDRAFRSTIDAINFLDDVINKRGVIFLSLRDRIDTSTPWGRRDYIKLAAEAECERTLISIRTRDGMAALKRRGRKFGPPRKLTKKKLARARLLLKQEKTIPQAAQAVRVSPRTLSRALAARNRKAKRRKEARCRG